MSENHVKVITTNRRARFDYHVESKLECGIALTGTEVKSLRDGSAQLSDAYAIPKSGELWLLNAQIPPYKPAGPLQNHDPKRTRKLLLHRREIDKLQEQQQRAGFALITGGTSGIGRVTARELARMGAKVVVVGRDPAKLDAVKREFGADAIRADLQLIADARRAAADFRGRYARLDVLVNNAGALYGQRQVTAEGLERTFALNHMAYFTLTTALLDLLQASAPARVVSVSSEAARGGRIDFADLQMKRRYLGIRQYCNTKLMNLLFAFELSRRLQGSGVTSNALHPGAIASGFAMQDAGWYGVLTRLARPFLIGEEKGARTQIWAASETSLEKVTGKYFVRQREKLPPRAALDQAAALRLWEESEKIAANPTIPSGRRAVPTPS